MGKLGENGEVAESQEFCFGSAMFEILLGHPYQIDSGRGRNKGYAGSHQCMDRN